ncbi:hypothetical protein PCNPT3_05340 [Psychromonas sp. CNPT3]|uniref:hypothetical protein n=1 Tax=Psychromonas sp. CNPT3 TaxID=314282 RepID=UPI00006E489E|nr:hypothetical protein [Psychromonas sp. CNPT3]AGH81010.1 hypothetical protein PCNPT3_05340 [Psychromonas sp. CNPT3]
MSKLFLFEAMFLSVARRHRYSITQQANREDPPPVKIWRKVYQSSLLRKTGQCDGSYTTVFYIDKSCSVARETTFKKWKYSGELAGLLILKNPTGALNKVLLPGGNGCVAITTEVAYQ